MPENNGFNTLPVPYQPGQSLELEVLENCDDLPLSQSVTAVISQTFDFTMSAVTEVTINTKSGSHIRAVLKLYDRRFGTDLRTVAGEHAPLTSENEAIFQSFVRQGKMAPFLQDLEREKKASIIPPRPWSQLDDPDTPEGRARFEAALWQESNKFFNCETKAYAQLKDIQGKSIPRLYAHVRLVRSSSEVPQELLQHPQLAQYLEIKGILLELIPGYDLRDLGTSPLAPSDTKMWSGIVQSAIGAAHDINRHGIIMQDCGPRNVVVNKDSQRAFIIDLAQCWLKGEMIESYRKEHEPDVEYWDAMRARGNHYAIGAVMETRLRRQRSVKLDIRYPDCDEIVEDLKARRRRTDT